jgi:hypothetical protein
MNEKEVCISCGMPMQTADDHAPGYPESPWCQHCSKPDGSLQTFEERFERMVQWEVKKKGADRITAERSTRDYMRTMPAWKDHPKLSLL